MRHPYRPFLIPSLLAMIAACSDPGGIPNQPEADAEPATAPAPAADPVPAAEPAPTPAENTAVVPERFRGRYAADAAACNAAGHESRLQIDADRIAFHESSGPVVSAMAHGDAITIKANVTGEGETREASWSFRLDPDGNTLTDVAAGMSRKRCG